MNITSRNIAIAVSFLLVGAIMYYLSDIVTYVLIAWVISMLGQPLMRFFNKIRISKTHHLPPSVGAVLTQIIFFLIIYVLVSLFVPLVVEQANNLQHLDYQAFITGLKEPLEQLTNWGHRFGLVSPSENVVDVLKNNFDNWYQHAQLGDIFRSALSRVGDLAVGILSVLFISFFFLKQQNMFTEFLTTIVPKNYEENVREAVRDTATMLTRYFSGLLLQMFFVTVFLSVTFIILGIKNAILIAIFAALINIVPYLGPMLGCAFAVFITVSSNLGLDFYAQIVPIIVKVVVVFGSMQLINDWLIQPLIFSNRVLAHPLEIFIITLIGAKIGGIGGMILAIPAYTVVRVIAREFFNRYKFVQKITNSMNESDILNN